MGFSLSLYPTTWKCAKSYLIFFFCLFFAGNYIVCWKDNTDFVSWLVIWVRILGLLFYHCIIDSLVDCVIWPWLIFIKTHFGLLSFHYSFPWFEVHLWSRLGLEAQLLIRVLNCDYRICSFWVVIRVLCYMFKCSLWTSFIIERNFIISFPGAGLPESLWMRTWLN